MKLYLTQIPKGYQTPSIAVIRAVRVAMERLQPDHKSSYTGASALIARGLPALLGETDDPDDLAAASLTLTEVGCVSALAEDLPDADPEPEPEPQVPQVSYLACQFALTAMKFAAGNPSVALHNLVTQARLVGETTEKPGVFREACTVLLDVFPPTLMGDVEDVVGAWAITQPDLMEHSDEA